MIKRALTVVTDFAVELNKFLQHNDIACEVSLYESETKTESAKVNYITVGNLPFTYDGEIQRGILNVNCHALDIATGVANYNLLEELTQAVVGFVGEELFLNGCYFSVKNEMRPLPDEDRTHFINLQIEVIYNDL